jgi:CheY-like chemotaxis protein/HPt (histidine-containing phosphotransfer) domain-containing protein
MIAAMPTVLIADDDPVSLGFLQAATESLGCVAMTAANGAQALMRDDADAVELLLLDLNMPDIGGPVLLRALRARGVNAPAIATSAGFEPSAAAALRAAGFADTLEKPASLETIEALLRRHLALDHTVRRSLPADCSSGTLPILDDTSALAAIGGDHDAMRALRKLFAQELELLERDLQSAAANPRALSERLHRLRASSGFCGAAALAAAAQRLEQALGCDLTSDAMANFARACSTTRHALAAQR